MSRSNLGKYLVITYLYHFHIRKIYERSLYLHFLVKALMLFMAFQKIWIQFITENCVGFFSSDKAYNIVLYKTFAEHYEPIHH